MQHTIHNMPAALDRALRARAQAENKSLDEVVVDALTRALGMTHEGMRPQRDLTGIAGSWQDDPTVTAALDEQRCIDPSLWQ